MRKNLVILRFIKFKKPFIFPLAKKTLSFVRFANFLNKPKTKANAFFAGNKIADKILRPKDVIPDTSFIVYCDNVRKYITAPQMSATAS